MNPDCNFLILVADSCRWDTYALAKTPNIDAHFEVVEAGACATFTYPAHAAMFQGFFPVSSTEMPLYNRFVTSLFRWFYTRRRDCIFEMSGQHSIPYVLHEIGYQTVLYGGVGWFRRRSPLCQGFNVFEYEPDAAKAISSFVGSTNKEPFFGLINFGATHRPYVCPGMNSDEVHYQSPRSGNLYESSERDKVLHAKQIRCLEYIDLRLQPLFQWLLALDRKTIVCFCADHGDCLGEDGCYGHGFSHPLVLRVPLAWSIFTDVATPIVDDKIIKSLK